MNGYRFFTPLMCACILTLANAFKPLVVDDPAYCWLAQAILQNPAQPFGPPPSGKIVIWYDVPEPFFQILIPPVVPYWLALGMAWLGPSPVLWKIWLFPFCWFFTFSLYQLLRRFCSGWERPLLAMTSLGPVYLPAVNLMLDLPALALTLSGIVLFLQAADSGKHRWRLCLCSGLVCGLAMQTKYTGFVSIGVLLWYGCLNQRFGLALFTSLIAFTVFVGWELYMGHVYSQSHFLYHVMHRPSFTNQGIAPSFWQQIQEKRRLITPLLGYLGGLAPHLFLGFVWALFSSDRCGKVGFWLLLLGFFAIVFVPTEYAVWTRSADGQERLTIASLFVGSMGIGILIGWSCSLAILIRSHEIPRKEMWFLLGWIGLEFLSYLALSPFGAARRIMGLVCVSTLLLGLMVRYRKKTNRAGFRWPVILSLLLGAFYCGVDFVDAQVEPFAVQESHRWIRQQDPQSTIWYCGRGGFSFYAQEQGMKPVLPGISQLHMGDWLVYPEKETGPYGPKIRIDPHVLQERHTFAIWNSFPVRTNSEYYAGSTPLRHWEQERLLVHIFQVVQSFDPTTNKEAAQNKENGQSNPAGLRSISR